MAVISRADAVWMGSLVSGSGVVSGVSSRAFTEQPISWASRTESPNGRTSPEELIAAAHAGCFSMALSAGLGSLGKPPERLEVSASVAFDKVDGGWRIVSSALKARGWVPGMDDASFQKEAEKAKDFCPVSQALKGNVALSVEASLAQ